jgi:linoleoyl-CoA desaturase
MIEATMGQQRAAVAPRLRFRPGAGAFGADVRRHAQRYLARRGSRFATVAVWAKGGALLAVAALSYIVLLTARLPGPALLGLGVLCGISCLLLAINLGHDAAHDTLSPSPRINRIVLRATFTPLGVDPALWKLRHVRAHHPFPNVAGCDIDIDENPYIRLSPFHRRRPWQRWQHLYAPLVYWLVSLHTVFVQDVQYLCKRQLANLRDIRHPVGTWVSFAAGKLAYLALVLGLPLWLIDLPAWQIVLGWLAAGFVVSICFVLMLIGTHFAEETAFPVAGHDGALPNDWATHQLATSLDWSPSSRWAWMIAGGANAHAAHHLFPNVSHAHYPALSRIIATAAARHGVAYNATTLPRMVASHFRFLRRMRHADA